MIILKFLVAFVAFAATLCLDNGGAQSKFIQLSSKFYISAEQKSFVVAWLTCKTNGMQLASVTSEEEQYEIENAAKAFKYVSPDGFWIGASTPQPYNSSSWRWIDSGLIMNYSNWGSGRPSYSVAHLYDNCVRLGNFNKVNEPYKWENVDCNLLLFFICKLPATK